MRLRKLTATRVFLLCIITFYSTPPDPRQPMMQLQLQDLRRFFQLGILQLGIPVQGQAESTKHASDDC